MNSLYQKFLHYAPARSEQLIPPWPIPAFSNVVSADGMMMMMIMSHYFLVNAGLMNEKPLN